ncbi:MAG: LLM class flavin-dependent oxidoreductase, partial [Pseudomonadota bacterium]
MQFSLFAHMERQSADQPQDQLQEEFIALCQLADEAGMRAVWTGEHHGMDFTIAPNPLMSLVNL